jgi:threonine/homoserine/homoserine lactone efflux protein
MPDLQHLLLFIAAGLLLNLTPGPDVLYIASNALRSGFRAGVVAGLGITAGCFVHVFAAALGLGALLAASATAFDVVKWLGAAYLVWVGVKLLLAKPAAGPERPAGWAAREAAPQRLARRRGRWGRFAGPACEAATAGDEAGGTWAVFRGGFLTNVLNPKVAIFFLAFVPQFIAPAAEHKTLAFLALGALFNINSIPINTGWALVAAWMARKLGAAAGRRAAPQAGESPPGAASHAQWGSVGAVFLVLDRVAGAMFIAFGLKLALADHPSL